MNKRLLTTGFFLIQLVFLVACGNAYEKVSDDKFIGSWELTGRGVFEGMQIKISRENDKLTGQIIKVNDNKYVKMFADTGDTWVSEISRKSNYEFSLTEKKIAGQLFSMYGLSTSMKYDVQFTDKNTIALAKPGSDPKKSSVFYKRIVN